MLEKIKFLWHKFLHNAKAQTAFYFVRNILIVFLTVALLFGSGYLIYLLGTQFDEELIKIVKTIMMAILLFFVVVIGLLAMGACICELWTYSNNVALEKIREREKVMRILKNDNV